MWNYRAAAASFIQYTIALSFTLTMTHSKNRFHILTIDTCAYMKQTCTYIITQNDAIRTALIQAAIFFFTLSDVSFEPLN